MNTLSLPCKVSTYNTVNLFLYGYKLLSQIETGRTVTMSYAISITRLLIVLITKWCLVGGLVNLKGNGKHMDLEQYKRPKPEDVLKYHHAM